MKSTKINQLDIVLAELERKRIFTANSFAVIRYHLEGKTVKEIAVLVSLSEQRVRTIIAKIIFSITTMASMLNTHKLTHSQDELVTKLCLALISSETKIQKLEKRLAKKP